MHSKFFTRHPFAVKIVMRTAYTMVWQSRDYEQLIAGGPEQITDLNPIK